MNTLVPLYVHPLADPWAWDAVAGLGDAVTVVVNVHDGPGEGRDPAYATVTARLAAAGVPMLGYVDLGYAGRPLATVLTEVEAWTAYPVGGVFFDQAPSSALSAGPVALAVRVARRAGLPDVVLNPGAPADPVYRELGVGICTYEGPWAEYRRDAGGPVDAAPDGPVVRPAAPGRITAGEGHLVYGVPADEVAEAYRLLASQGVAFGLVSELRAPTPYAGLPGWLADSAAVHS